MFIDGTDVTNLYKLIKIINSVSDYRVFSVSLSNTDFAEFETESGGYLSDEDGEGGNFWWITIDEDYVCVQRSEDVLTGFPIIAIENGSEQICGPILYFSHGQFTFKQIWDHIEDIIDMEDKQADQATLGLGRYLLALDGPNNPAGLYL